jgi:hypothetical protein
MADIEKTIYFVEALLPSGNVLTLRSTAPLPLFCVTDLERAGLFDALVETYDVYHERTDRINREQRARTNHV